MDFSHIHDLDRMRLTRDSKCGFWCVNTEFYLIKINYVAPRVLDKET